MMFSAEVGNDNLEATVTETAHGSKLEITLTIMYMLPTVVFVRDYKTERDAMEALDRMFPGTVWRITA